MFWGTHNVGAQAIPALYQLHSEAELQKTLFLIGTIESLNFWALH
ncbi:hypothetical protein [Arsenophonus endosymbiont of Aleurodicus floccissimus]